MQRTEPLTRGLWGVLATPLRQGPADVDDTALRRQVELHHAAGSTGLVVLGVFGEGARLTTDEQDHVVDIVTAEAGDLPIVVGLSALDTSEAVDAAQRLAAKCHGGTPSFMVQVNTNVPDTLAAHFASIHEATGAGVVVQDSVWGSRSRPVALNCGQAATGSYSLIKPPRIGRRTACP